MDETAMSPEIRSFTRWVCTYVAERISLRPGRHDFAHARTLLKATQAHETFSNGLKQALSDVPASERDYKAIRDMCIQGSRPANPVNPDDGDRRIELVDMALSLAGLEKPIDPKPASLKATLNSVRDPFEGRLTPL